MATPLALRPYQDGDLAAVPTAALCGTRRQMLVMPPGAGKTVVFAELARRVVANPEIIRAPGKRIAILAHRDELVSQAVAKLRCLAPGLRVDRRSEGEASGLNGLKTRLRSAIFSRVIASRQPD